jgi:glycosyltransferase involved in cell wall biosynthesis
MKVPDVSVIMPVRNGARYVGGAVASVLSEKGVNLELLVVDDGSTDDTRQRIDEVSDERVRVIAGPEKGVAAAMNAGLAAAQGRYMARCDSDDRFPPDRLPEQFAFLESHPEFGAVCGRFEVLDAKDDVVRLTPAAGERARELTSDLRQGKVDVHLCTYLVRREVMLSVGGFRSYFRTGSDIDFQLRLCEQTRVWYEPKMRYRYRLHEQSITHRHSDRLLQFNDAVARQFQSQRAERSRRGEPGLDDLELGCAPVPPERGEAAPQHRPDPREQLWRMRWGEAWRAHSRGERARGVMVGIRAMLLRPWRPEAWRGLLALCVKSTPIWKHLENRSIARHETGDSG